MSALPVAAIQALRELSRAQLAAYTDGYGKLVTLQLRALQELSAAGSPGAGAPVLGAEQFYIGSETSEWAVDAVHGERCQKEELETDGGAGCTSGIEDGFQRKCPSGYSRDEAALARGDDAHGVAELSWTRRGASSTATSSTSR